MRFSTLLLLVLGSNIGTPLDEDQIGDDKAYHHGAGTNIFHRHTYVVRKMYQMYSDAHQRQHNRYKRTLSPFLLAWKRILETTFGFRRINILGIRGQVLAKKETYTDALQDLVSLKPNQIVEEKYGLRGVARNHVIELVRRESLTPPTQHILDPKDARVYKVNSPNKSMRTIVYYPN